MNESDKIEIAKDFVSRHKNSNVEEWQPFNLYGDQKYLQIYHNLMGDIYGEARELDAEYDDDGNIVSEATEYECEISSLDSKTGASILFTWEIV